jgi:hypothetical protein
MQTKTLTSLAPIALALSLVVVPHSCSVTLGMMSEAQAEEDSRLRFPDPQTLPPSPEEFKLKCDLCEDYRTGRLPEYFYRQPRVDLTPPPPPPPDAASPIVTPPDTRLPGTE